MSVVCFTAPFAHSLLESSSSGKSFHFMLIRHNGSFALLACVSVLKLCLKALFVELPMALPRPQVTSFLLRRITVRCLSGCGETLLCFGCAATDRKHNGLLICFD